MSGGAAGIHAYIAIGYLEFDSVAGFESSFNPHTREIIADIPNYTNAEPLVQVAEPNSKWTACVGCCSGRCGLLRAQGAAVCMKIIAITNIKGGVGKTTTAVNLAYLSAAGGQRTLLWDLDPQGAATWLLRCQPGERPSAKKLLKWQAGAA